jgi:hypothetical protein
MRKSRTPAAQGKPPDPALAPVWVEADELHAFRSWWDALPASQRTARKAFLHGLRRADAAWGVIYQRLRDELQAARESLRVVHKEVSGVRTANEDLRVQLDHAIDRATDAEERVVRLTTPPPREYD